jgi:hypothetical protein
MTRQLTSAAPATAAGPLNNLLCAALIGALGLITAPAHAAVITFDATENVVTAALAAGDTGFNTGDAFTEAGYTLQVNNNPTAEPDEYGAVGALIDSNNAFACQLTACPVGSGSMYFAGLNDGWLNITNAVSPGFRLDSLRYAFVAPLSGLLDFSYGRLMLTGTTMAGATISAGGDFPGQDAAGRFTFDRFLPDPAFRNTTLTSLSINACLFDAAGDCVSARFLTQNQAQFAVDDLALTAIPEPSSSALMLLGMAGLTLVARRRSAAPADQGLPT